MDDPVADALASLDASTQSLVRTVETMRDDQVAEPSLLPDWTRGHVLTHLARNGDALVNLVTWARTGTETAMYPSREHRAADIEAGSTRPVGDHLADISTSAERLRAALHSLTAEHWQRTIAWGRESRRTPAALIPVLRRVEVEVHHVDLDLDYTLAHLPEDLVEWMIADRAAELSARDDLAGFVLTANDDEGRWVVRGGGPEITGTPPSLLGWLLGRTDGIGLYSERPLPHLGAWR